MSRRQCLYGLILLLGIAFKLWLIAGMAITDDANDPSHYVEQILFQAGSCYGFGTELVGRLFYRLGVPFRWGIEILFLTASLLLVRTLVASPVRSGPALTLYLFVLFNPAPAELCSHLMSDQVWLVETMAGFAFFVWAVQKKGLPRSLYLILAILCLGLSTITRTVLAPLLAGLGLWALLGMTLLGRKGLARAMGADLWMPSLGLVSGIVIIYFSTCSYNRLHNGFFGISAFDSREYLRFYLCLQSVGQPSGPPYFPIDYERRQLIRQAGPVSRRFMDKLETDRQFKAMGLKTYGRSDLATTWFHWAVFEMASPDGDLARPFALFQQIENEIARAGAEHRLEIRPVLPLPDTRVGIVLAVFPAALRHACTQTLYQPPRYAWCWYDEPRFDNVNFSRALTRQAIPLGPARAQVGHILCLIYPVIYRALGILFLPNLFLLILLVLWRRRWPFGFSPGFWARQIFLVLFGVLFLWYAWFDASGLVLLSRYLIFNNVLLPILFFYYARQLACLGEAGKSVAFTP